MEEIDPGPNSPLTRSSFNHGGIKSIVLFSANRESMKMTMPTLPGFRMCRPAHWNDFLRAGEEREHQVRLVLVKPVGFHLFVLCIRGW